LSCLTSVRTKRRDFNAEDAGQLDKASVRYLRYANGLATVVQGGTIERCRYPREPPILYPAPDSVEGAHERRPKWALRSRAVNPTTEKIRSRSPSRPPGSVWICPSKTAYTFMKEYQTSILARPADAHDERVWRSTSDTSSWPGSRARCQACWSR